MGNWKNGWICLEIFVGLFHVIPIVLAEKRNLGSQMFGAEGLSNLLQHISVGRLREGIERLMFKLNLGSPQSMP